MPKKENTVVSAIRKEDSLPTQKTVLFVCEHGAARSTIAAAYFTKYATEQGLPYKAIFRGTSPDSVLTIGTQKGLAADGFAIDAWKPSFVSEQDVRLATKIITFDCIIPHKDTLTTSVQTWNGIPPISKDYGVARDSIVKRVKLLVEELAKEKK